MTATRSLLAGIACALCAGTHAEGQSTSAADSAAAARAAWARAGQASRAGDIATAHREASRAATAWPVQPAYLWGHATIAAAAGDTAGFRAALERYASLGLGQDLATRTFNGLERLGWYRPLADRITANAAESSRSRPYATLPDSTFWPEGIDHDPRTGAIYVTSLAHGTIAEIRSGVTRELWPRSRPDIGRVFAVRVGPGGRSLFATMTA